MLPNWEEYWVVPTKGNVMLVKLVQPLNAKLPITVTLSGIETLVNPLQSLNASAPILVTLLPIVTLVKLVQL